MEPHNKVHPEESRTTFYKQASTVSTASTLRISLGEPDGDNFVNLTHNSSAPTPPLTMPHDVASGHVIIDAEGNVMHATPTRTRSPGRESPTRAAVGEDKIRTDINQNGKRHQRDCRAPSPPPISSHAGVTSSGAGVTSSGAGVTPSGAGVTPSGAGVTSSDAGVTSSRPTDADSVGDMAPTEEPISDEEADGKSQMDDIARVILAYWHQVALEGEAEMHQAQPSKQELREEIEQIVRQADLESKDKVRAELQFILNKFRQRRCTNFCGRKDSFFEATRKMLLKKGKLMQPRLRKYCVCGLPDGYHIEEALDQPTAKWDPRKNTEEVYPGAFGNLDIPGHYNYLDTPAGTRKYLRLDDLRHNPGDVWTLLLHHWNMHPPNLVISVTGGDIPAFQDNVKLYKAFRDGIIKSAVTTKAWIITEGLHIGAAREIGEIFQTDLPRSSWSERNDHANVPLIAVAPWGVIADRKHLSGIHLGLDETVYLYQSIERHSETTVVPNSLDPYHVVYLFPDDGTSGTYKKEPRMRRALEKYIRKQTTPQLLGIKDVRTPVLVLVLGGDRFTLEKLADVTQSDSQISVVIVNGSGPLADMLADIYTTLEFRKPRSASKQYGWSPEEENILLDMAKKYENEGLLRKDTDSRLLIKIMHARHLIEVFGLGEKNVRDLDKAILKAVFGGIKDMSVQLHLSLAMDRCDIAEDEIFVESRKQERKDHREVLQEVLLVALRNGNTDFVNLLLDKDYGGELDFEKFLTVRRLFTLHESNLDESTLMGKVLRSLCMRDRDGIVLLNKNQLLPQVGRIVYKLMGNSYRLLYQEKEYRKVTEEPIPLVLTRHRREEPAWHLFIWAVLANNRYMADVFLYESNCKIGAALVAFKMFSQMAAMAESLSETELEEDLRENAEHFQEVAVTTLDNLYEFSRDEAYASLVALLPFHWGRYVTPMHIGEDAGAMRFMGHACCQTFLNRVWMRYMELDTKNWKLLPFWAFFPVQLPSIVFDRRNLAYGTYRKDLTSEEGTLPVVKGAANRTRVPSTGREIEETPAGGAPGFEANDDTIGIRKGRKAPSEKERRSTAWFRIKNYYTAPVNKFIFYMVSWVIFLGIFTHFILTELRPLNTASDVTVYEWLLIVWVASITLDEIKQLFWRQSSGPLYMLHSRDLEQYWRDTWSWHERLAFVLRLYKFTDWISDRWNKIDATMILSFWASVACHFLVPLVDFALVRVVFAFTIIVFYFRLLRIGYVMENIGPRVLTIQAMLKDLFQFILILAVFIISFGVAFQAILNPNTPASWDMLVDVLWRPYWQMYGELYIDDATTEMGRPVSGSRTCTLNRTLAEAQPEDFPFCYNWMAPLLLAVFMLITNILLLNLLIAIFSHSFDKVESQAHIYWRFHMYDLVHEHYHHVWLPPPLNILCHVTNVTIWLATWPRKWCGAWARRRHVKRLANQRTAQVNLRTPMAQLHGFVASIDDKKVEEDMRTDCCYPFYYQTSSAHQEQTDHFCQPENMRDEDLEEKAYKRYRRAKKKSNDHSIKKLLESHDERLLQISSELQNLKLKPRDSAIGSQGDDDLEQSDRVRHVAPYYRPNSNVAGLKQKMDWMNRKIDDVTSKMDAVIKSVENMTDLFQSKALTTRLSTISSIPEENTGTKKAKRQ